MKKMALLMVCLLALSLVGCSGSINLRVGIGGKSVPMGRAYKEPMAKVPDGAKLKIKGKGKWNRKGESKAIVRSKVTKTYREMPCWLVPEHMRKDCR